MRIVPIQPFALDTAQPLLPVGEYDLCTFVKPVWSLSPKAEEAIMNWFHNKSPIKIVGVRAARGKPGRSSGGTHWAEVAVNGIESAGVNTVFVFLVGSQPSKRRIYINLIGRCEGKQ